MQNNDTCQNCVLPPYNKGISYTHEYPVEACNLRDFSHSNSKNLITIH